MVHCPLSVPSTIWEQLEPSTAVHSTLPTFRSFFSACRPCETVTALTFTCHVYTVKGSFRKASFAKCYVPTRER